MIYQFPMSLFTCSEKPNWKKLRTELNTIASLYQMAQCCPNYLTLSFNDELTQEQINAINECICNHTIYTPPPHDKFYTITPGVQSTSSSKWEKIAVFKHDLATTINYIEIISYSDGNTYDIKVEDSAGNPVAQTSNLVNTDMQVIDLGTITQPVTNICILYAQTAGTVYLESLIVYI